MAGLIPYSPTTEPDQTSANFNNDCERGVVVVGTDEVREGGRGGLYITAYSESDSDKMGGCSIRNTNDTGVSAEERETEDNDSLVTWKPSVSFYERDNNRDIFSSKEPNQCKGQKVRLLTYSHIYSSD